MKNHIFHLSLVVFLSFLFTAVSTNRVYADVFSFGFSGGLNASKVDGKKAYNLDGWSPESDKGWNVGVKFRAVGPAVGIGADVSLLYNREAICLGDDIDDVAQSLALPVHLRYELKLPLVSRAVTPFAFVGPQFCWNLKELDFGLDKDRSVGGNWDENLDKFKVHQKDYDLKIDAGLGVLLFSHLEVFYTYSFPCSKSFSLENVSQVQGELKELKENYKIGSHRLGISLYF